MTAEPDSPAPHGGPFAHKTDEELLAAYEETTCEGPGAEMMLAEIERRGLDV